MVVVVLWVGGEEAGVFGGTVNVADPREHVENDEQNVRHKHVVQCVGQDSQEVDGVSQHEEVQNHKQHQPPRIPRRTKDQHPTEEMNYYY